MKNIRYKILFLTGWYPDRLNPVSGIFIKKQAVAVSRFHDVSVLYIGVDPRMKEKKYDIQYSIEDNILEVKVYYKKIDNLFRIFRYLKAAYKGFRVIREKSGRPDFIHVNIIMPVGFLALLLKYLKNIPYVITEHCDIYLRKIRGFERIGLIFLRIARLIVNKSSGLIVDSTNMKDAMIKLGFYNRIYVVPNVVTAMADGIKYTAKREWHKAIHISLLDDRQKNLSGLFRVVARVLKIPGREDFQLHIVGNGPGRGRLEKLAAEYGILNKGIYFHGFLPEKKKMDLLSGSSFHILNSNYEGFSVVTAEAIAFGVPVIATRSGGPEDFVTKDVGILIEPGNEKQLEDAILFMLDNSYKYKRKKLIEYADSRFSYDVVGRQICDLYRKNFTEWEAGWSGQNISINPDWLVLDVGSGHHPFRRANVLLEKTTGKTIHRTVSKINVPEGTSLIIGDALAMPFRRKKFDFICASHIAEHVDKPLKLCEEMQKVSKRGYLETPGPLSEFFLNEPAHRWLVYRTGKKIVFRRKKIFRPASNFFYRIFNLNKGGLGHKPYYSNNFVLKIVSFMLRIVWKYIPFAYTKYFWSKKIECRIIDKNPQND